MANIGGEGGLSSPAIEQDPSIAQIQAAQLGAQSAQQQVSLPATGFVASLNGEEGAIDIQPGTSTTGVTVVITNGLGTVSIGVTIPVLTTFGTIITHNQAAAVADLNQTISNPPTQAEVQALSDKVDELLDSLRAAGIIAT